MLPLPLTPLDNCLNLVKVVGVLDGGEFPIENGKALQFIYSSKQFKTKGALAAGTATTNVYRNAHFKKTMKAMQTP
ncbi:hypothetical protein KY285_035959 [Solanum tuberosum]|nr:hypothetical protein KY285_035959 [Solanum tuberosum]